MSEFVLRILTAIPLSILGFLALVWLPSLYLSFLVMLLCLYVLFSEWPPFKQPKLTFLYPVLPFACLAYITYDKTWLAIMIATVIASDSFAYCAGKLIGKHKLAPRISPGKTWEGFFAGVLGGIITGLVVGKILSPHFINWLHGTILLGITLSAAFGDLFESYLKRKAHIKDSGRILPGHGGVLDRFDSIIMAATFLTLVLYMVR